MKVELFNTLTRRVEPLRIEANKMSLYVCGVTPYDTTHLGHAFTYVSFDTLVRLLRWSGVEVVYAQNVTDIDDDILRKAKELGLPYDELARREIKRFREDMDALNVLRPDRFVAATDAIPQIVDAVRHLIEMERAYVSDDNVYFDNRTFPGYGEICHCPRAEMISLAAQHGGFPDDPRKRDPLDFLLWQKHLPGEPEWPSPFGPGRPGWHIECSTIATTVLGLPVDVHGGGSDLIFPHHASEIAQAESIDGMRPFVRHWMHNAMVLMNGVKMSKSLGNMVFVDDLLSRHGPDALRLYLLSHHYREPFEFNQRELDEKAMLAGQLAMLAERSDLNSRGADQSHSAEALEHVTNDLMTPSVVTMLASLVDRVDRDPKVADRTGPILTFSREVLGLRLGRMP